MILYYTKFQLRRYNRLQLYFGKSQFYYIFYFIHLRRKLNSLQRYDIAQNCRILHRVVQRLAQHNLKISHHRHI
jgi:hypothetical protein